MSQANQAVDRQLACKLAVRVTPRARRNEIAGVLQDGTVKVHLTAPPVEGKANQALIDFLSEVLDVPRTDIEIIAGKKGRTKLVSLHGMEERSVQERLVRFTRSD